jgi:nitrite reductase/ring-hydroxylating ferredoxin subunit
MLGCITSSIRHSLIGEINYCSMCFESIKFIIASKIILYKIHRYNAEICIMIFNTKKQNVRTFLLMALITMMTFSCKKEEQAPEIPYVYVNFILNPNGTEYIHLNVVNGWETVRGGYNGILVFRKSVSEFSAFERACPYDPLVAGAQVRVDESGITCFCPVCGSKFILVDGTPYEGPSHFSLKQYSTVYDGAMLYISN